MHNDKELEIDLIGFNKEQFNAEMAQIRQTVFDNAIEEGATTEEAVKEVQKTTKEAEEFLEKEEVKQTAKKLKKINKELKKVEEKQKKLEEETPELKTAAEGLPENNNTIDSEKVSEYKKLQEQKEELTREGLFAEQFVYELTEDYADKHGWREEVKESLQRCFGKLCGFVSNVFGKITGEEAEAMDIVGEIVLGIGIGVVKNKAKKAFTKFLVKKLMEKGLSQLEIKEKLGDSTFDEANTESFDECDDVSTGVFERSSKKSSTSASSRSTMNSGGGSAMPPDPEKEPRKSSTRQDADNYINGLKESGKLSKKGVTKDGHEYYKIMEKVKYKGTKFKKGDYVSRDELHHEWEWFRGKDKHQGAIDSITGKLFEDSAVKSRTLKLP